jgi:Mg-chelatase subunit ChlD
MTILPHDTKDIETRIVTDSVTRRRIGAVRSVFEKIDRIVTGKRINVRTPGKDDSLYQTAGTLLPPGTPSWTDGETIYIAQQNMADDLNNRTDQLTFLVNYLGLNYHELSHCLFSPRQSDPFTTWLMGRNRGNANWFWCYNALEDQRIESLFTAMYPTAALYFKAAVLRFLISDPSTMGRSFPLVTGRGYLSPALRDHCRKTFVAIEGESLASEIESVVSDYNTVVFPQDTAKAQNLVVRFYALMVKESSSTGVSNVIDAMPKDGGCTHVKVQVTAGTPASRKAQQKASDAVAQAQKEEHLDRLDRLEDEIENDRADDTDGTGNSKASDQGDQDGQGGKGDQDGDSGAKQQGAGGKAAGSGTSEMGDPMLGGGFEKLIETISGLYDEVKAELESTLDDSQLKDDVKSNAQDIRAAALNVEASGLHAKARNVSAASMVPHSRKVAEQIRQLRTDLEPAWIRSQPIGRVNVRRMLARRADPSVVDVFDQWDEGSEEEATVEVVVLVDMSGSMYDKMQEASEAMWILKTAFEKHGMATTVLGFSESHFVLYKPSDKIPRNEIPVFGSMGGTNPVSALQQAFDILSQTSATNKLCCIVTDGSWNCGSDKAEPLIRSMRRSGVVTMLLGLDRAVAQNGTHDCEVHKDISSPKEIVALVQDAVVAMSTIAQAGR